MNSKNRRVVSQLHSNQEIVGTLYAVKEENKCYKLQFICIKEIEIPPIAIPREQLTSLIGKRIGIFNCNGCYKTWVIQGKNHTKKKM